MAKAQTQVGSRAIRAIFADAARRAEEAVPAQSPDPNLPRNGILPGRWPGYPSDNMPPADTGIRVRVVGRDAEGKVHLITTSGHMRRIEKWDHATLADIFAPDTNTLKYCWPAFGKLKSTDPETGEVVEKLVVKRAERDPVIECLINEAARKRDFDPYSQHRGRGGWQDSQGNFLWHSGGYIWTSVKAGGGHRLDRARPAEHDGFLYTRMPETIEPWAEPVTQEESPARRILKDLQTWNWQRPYLDPILVLGWIGTAIMGGALKARPIVFTTGGAGVGKSTLHELVKTVLANVVTTSVNTTAAGIYQRAKLDSLPFIVDELESKAGSTRADAVIELARVAYTGGDISRGGADHEATTFTARNSFLFSAINAPPMGAQDRTRMALLNLARLDARAAGPHKMTVSPDTDGRMILRQIMDGWSDFNGRLQANYWEELSQHGHDSRAIDTFGTLLAAAELLVGVDALEEVGLPATEPGRVGEMVAAATEAERSENLDNWHACLDHLFQSSIDAWRDGTKPTIGAVCEAMRLKGHEEQFLREKLQLVNLGAVDKGKLRGHPELGPVLAVPADGPVLQRIFADTSWHKGVWYSALKQAPKAIVHRDLGNAQKVKINASTKHCLLVDLDAFERFAAGGGES